MDIFMQNRKGAVRQMDSPFYSSIPDMYGYFSDTKIRILKLPPVVSILPTSLPVINEDNNLLSVTMVGLVYPLGVSLVTSLFI